MSESIMKLGLRILYGFTILLVIIAISYAYYHKTNNTIGVVKKQPRFSVESVSTNEDYKDNSEIKDTSEYKEINKDYRDKIRLIMKVRFNVFTLKEFNTLFVLKKDINLKDIPNDRLVYSDLINDKVIIGYFNEKTEDYEDVIERKEK